jgi:hypothetical protein
MSKEKKRLKPLMEGYTGLNAISKNVQSITLPDSMRYSLRMAYISASGLGTSQKNSNQQNDKKSG